MYLRLFTVTCWGIPSSLRAPNLSADFYSPFDLVVDPYELHTRAYPPSLGSLDLSQASLYFDLVVDSYKFVILGHIPSYRVCLHRYPSYPLSLGHLIISPSCQFNLSFSGPHLYQLVIFLSVCIQFELGLHLYQSVIFLSVCVQFKLGPHLYRSVIVLSI